MSIQTPPSKGPRLSHDSRVKNRSTKSVRNNFKKVLNNTSFAKWSSEKTEDTTIAIYVFSSDNHIGSQTLARNT